MEGVNIPTVSEPQEDSAIVSPEQLLSSIVHICGEEFVVIPLFGWGKIVETIKESTDETLIQKLDTLKVPVVPVSLQPKEEESRIIMPNGSPRGESKIIIP